MEEQPRDEQPKPDDEAEQAHHIDDGQFADAFLHELAEVRHHADGEEGESLYGKYLVSTYAKTEEARATASFSNEALAPAKVDLKAPVAQWVSYKYAGVRCCYV